MVKNFPHAVFIFIAVLLELSLTSAQAATTQEVFAKSKGAVIQVRVLDIASGAQQSLGTGFHVGNGLYITNYHVIADLLDKHQKLKTLAQMFDQQEFKLELVSLDVVHDLAVLRGTRLDLPTITLSGNEPERGERLYSLGNPLDIGFTIVEGNYNGPVKGDPRQSFHFTGSINPGMSGGPTITESGTAIGINVASSGEEVSYLVPAKYAMNMLARASQKTQAAAAPSALRNLVREQLLAEQERISREFLSAPLKSTQLGNFKVLDSNVEWITCWGTSSKEKKQLLKTSKRSCSSGATIFLSDDFDVNTVAFSHLWLDGADLSPAQFLNRYGKIYAAASEKKEPDKEKINPAVCQQDFFWKSGTAFRAVTCINLYKDYPGLYNIRFRAASQGSLHNGMVTTLILDGFSMGNAKKMISHYIDSLRGARQ